MKTLRSSHFFPSRLRPRGQRPGFALIITITLMALLLLLVLTLVTLVQTNLQLANNQLRSERARQEAFLGVQIAVGQLQKLTGPDQRTTTTADLFLIDDATDPGSVDIPHANPNSTDSGWINDFKNLTDNGGTRKWTGVWGNALNPQTLYTQNPKPVLLGWLVSGNEGSYIPFNPLNGQITAPANNSGHPPKVVNNFSPEQVVANLDRNSSALSPSITINDRNGVPVPAVVLVGPNSVGNNSANKSYYYVVAPLANITVPSNQLSGSESGINMATVGRYAYFVQDEGVKAKYNVRDAYAAAAAIQQNTMSDYRNRVRFLAAQRTGIDLMINLPDYPNTNDGNASSQNSKVAYLLDRVFTPALARYAYGNQDLASNKYTLTNDPLLPHYHDLTTTSYGVLADTLRGGLRYDLTAAFENNAAFNPGGADTAWGLAGKFILPTDTNGQSGAYGNPVGTPGGTSNAITTEPVLAIAGKENALLAYPTGWGIPGGKAKNLSPVKGPIWDTLRSFNYLGTMIANNGGVEARQTMSFYDGSAVKPSTTNGGNQTEISAMGGPSAIMGITPTIVGGRLKFGFVYDNQTPLPHNWIAVFVTFIIANPYNFPVVATNGLDISMRLSAKSTWEWGIQNRAVVVNRVDPGNGELSNNLQPRPFIFANAFTHRAVTPFTDYTKAYGLGDVFSLGQGYYPILKNRLDNSVDSVLDRVIFHLKGAKGNSGTPAVDKITFAPGETKVFVLDANLGIGAPTNTFKAKLRQPGPASYGLTNALVPGATYVPMKDTGLKFEATALTYQQIDMIDPSLIPVSPTQAFMAWDTGDPTKTSGVNNTFAVPADTPPSEGPQPAAAPTVYESFDRFGNNIYMFPGQAFDIEMRAGGVGTVPRTPWASKFVLQTITGMDLTGARATSSDPDFSPFNVITNGNNPSTTDPKNGTRPEGEQIVGQTGSVGAGLNYIGLPRIISSYYWWLALPQSGSFTYKANGQVTSFESSSKFVNYRTFADFNLRSSNMALFPGAVLNTPGLTAPLVPTNGMITTAPYFRMWDRGLDRSGLLYTTLDTDQFFKDLSNFKPKWGRTTATIGQQYVALFNLPSRSAGSSTDVPLVSLGQLQHADVTADDFYLSVGYQPGNAIGNSWYNPYVNTVQAMQNYPNLSVNVTANNFNAYDISYLMNVALWDRFYFSTIPQTGNAVSPINARLKYAAGYTPAKADLGIGFARATNPDLGGSGATNPVRMLSVFAPARYLMIDGAFNINSTSVEAWKAMLSSLRNSAINGKQLPGTTPFPRVLPNSLYSSAGSAAFDGVDLTGAIGTNDASFAGFRRLSDSDISTLATQIVQQVRSRGPFLSLAQFVNRSFGTAAELPFRSGPLQAAIDGHYLNKTSYVKLNQFPGLETETVTTLPGNTLQPNANIGGFPDNSRSTGIPGWFTQADLLQVLGPVVAARSDTFVVRAYGDIVNPADNSIQSRAWCEAVVQRLPEYFDNTMDPELMMLATGSTVTASGGSSQPSALNKVFGRRYKIVSVRWLSPNDI